MRRGIVMFVPTRHGIHRGVEGFLTELWNHRPYVLMHEEWSYRGPSDQYKWQGSVMFVATRHNIHSAEWMVSEQNCGSTDLAF
ncbi:hypothetical protein TNCT_384161 [Trichonephila clavata]|nr:hypothetical protein TNCT_384161 [Trichonephila clavata]